MMAKLLRPARTILVATMVCLIASFASALGPQGSQSQSGGAGIFGASGSSSIDTGSGAPHVDYDFALPPGRLTPGLSLTYAQRSGTGDAGENWALSLPTISRGRRPIPPNTYNAAPQPYAAYPFPFTGSYDPTRGSPDRFEIDGELLVPICYVNHDTCAGYPNLVFPSYLSGAVYYRKQHDTDYAQYFLLSAGTAYREKTWIERTKDGHVRIFGAIPSSLSLPALPGTAGAYEYMGPTPLNPTEPANQVAVRWHLSAEYDIQRLQNSTTPSNPIIYRWVEAAGSQRSYLKDVFYDHADDGTDAETAWVHHIQFGWESPTYRTVDYAATWASRPNLRLNFIEISSRVDGETAERKVSSHYRLDYHPDSPRYTRSRSYLKSIQREGACGDTELLRRDILDPRPARQCDVLPPTTYDYTGIHLTDGWLVQNRTHHTTLDSQDPVVFPKYETTSVLDANRDGWPDIYVQSNDSVPEQHSTFASSPRLHINKGLTGSTSSFEQFVVSNTLLGDSAGIALNPGLGLTFVDFRSNTAGSNIIYAKHESTQLCSAELVNLSSLWSWSPTGCFTPSNWERCIPCEENGTCNTQCQGTPCECAEADLVGDIDGDGTQDVIARSYNRSSLINNVQEGRFSWQWAGTEHAGEVRVAPRVTLRGQVFSTLVDMNGDGVADLVAAATPTSNTLGVWYGAGDGRFGCSGACEFTSSFVCVAPPSGSQQSCAPGMLLTDGSSAPQLGLWSDAGEPDIGFCPPDADGDSGTNCGRSVDRRPALYVHDVTGDGLADVIRVLPYKYDSSGYPDFDNSPKEQLRWNLWVNQDGKSFVKDCPTGATECQPVVQTEQPGLIDGGNREGVPKEMMGDARVSFVDIDASGTDDIVFTFKDAVYFVDLHFGSGLGTSNAGMSPGLLAKVENGYGAYTLYEYDTLQKLGLGKNWASQTLAVTPVVTARIDGVSGPAMVQRAQRTEYEYADPAYDTWKKTLVGFGTVAEKPAGSAWVH